MTTKKIDKGTVYRLSYSQTKKYRRMTNSGERHHARRRWTAKALRQKDRVPTTLWKAASAAPTKQPCSRGIFQVNGQRHNDPAIQERVMQLSFFISVRASGPFVSSTLLITFSFLFPGKSRVDQTIRLFLFFTAALCYTVSSPQITERRLLWKTRTFSPNS